MIVSIALFVVGTISSWECVNANVKRYDGYKVIQTDVSKTTDGLTDIFRKYQVDVWRHPSVASQSFDIMVSPDNYESVTMDLTGMGANFSVVISNVQHLIDEEQNTISEGRQKRHLDGGFFRRYHPYEEIRSWMRGFAKANRDIVRLQRVGVTYRGRQIIAVKIGIPRNTTKKIIWQDGGIHAREWISSATLMWVMRRLVKGYRDKDPIIERYLREMDWYVLPVWNVDGYKYSWTRNRLRRKTLGPRGSVDCFGVDLNRNFDTQHRGSGTASDDACSEVYHGTHAFSAIESLSVSQFLLRKKKNSLLAALMTLHSYAQQWLYPYGYKYGSCRDYDELYALSSRVVQAISGVHGTQYKHGSVSDLAYKVSGSSVDWSYDSLCIKYSFAIELRDTGQHGFVLPQSQIIPSAEEYFEGMKIVADHVIGLSRQELRSYSCVAE